MSQSVTISYSNTPEDYAAYRKLRLVSSPNQTEDFMKEAYQRECASRAKVNATKGISVSKEVYEWSEKSEPRLKNVTTKYNNGNSESVVNSITPTGYKSVTTQYDKRGNVTYSATNKSAGAEPSSNPAVERQPDANTASAANAKAGITPNTKEAPKGTSNDSTTGPDGEPIEPNPEINPKVPEHDGQSTTAQDPTSLQFVDPETNIFYLDTKVFIEGVQVPHAQVSISYGIGEPPTATIVIPANNFLRELPGTTKIHVIHKDLLPNEKGEYKYRLIFDGELSSYSYNIDPTGAYITISAIHCCAYLTFMQLMNQEVREYIVDQSWQAIGSGICFLKNMYSTFNVQLMRAIFENHGDALKSMADVAYVMLHYLIDEGASYSLNGNPVSSASKWYKEKLGADGFNIPGRIFGVSDGAKGVQLGDYTDGYKTKAPKADNGAVGNVQQVSDYANIHATGTSLEERMQSLQGKISYRSSDGTNCVRTISIALEGTPYGGLVNTDQLLDVARSRGDIVLDNTLRPGDIVVATDILDSNFGHAMVAKRNSDGSIGTIQNGASAGGVYESDTLPTRMFSNKQYTVIRPKGLKYRN